MREIMSKSDATETVAPGETPLLEVENLSVAFPTEAGPVLAVDGVSFKLFPGRTLCLVGESGCGKSMTALAVMGLNPKPGKIASGRVSVTAVVTTADGTVVGGPTTFTVRVSPTSDWIYWVLGGIAGLVIVIGAVRTVLRRRPDV